MAYPKGTVMPLEFHSVILDSDRRGQIYVPAQYDAAVPACSMFVQDGSQYAKNGGPDAFDRAIALGQMPVTVVVMLDPVRRSEEYDTVSDRYARFLRDEVIPLVDKRYNLRKDANSRAVMGVSSGGICAFEAAWFMPETFRRVCCQSGSFANIRGGDVFPKLVHDTPKKEIMGYMAVAQNDVVNNLGSWLELNHKLWAELRAKEYDFEYYEDRRGHSYHAAAAQLPIALWSTWRGYP